MRRSCLNFLRCALLFGAAMVQFGCAGSTPADGVSDPNSDLQPVPSHDDSHGWGTNVQGT